MPKWLKKDLEESGVDNPYALMNAAGIMKGSKTLVESREGVAKKMKAFMKAKHYMKKAGKGKK